MHEFLQFVLLGLGSGAVYALSAQGIVLVYRGSGVVNLAHGGIGIASAFLFWDLRAGLSLPVVPAALIAVLFGAIVGLLFHRLVMMRLSNASALVRVVATLALLILLQGLATKRYGGSLKHAEQLVPTTNIPLPGGLSITADRVVYLVLSVVFAAILWFVYKYTKFGIGTSAVAENPRAAASLGWSAGLVAAVNWAAGCALASVSSIILAPISGLTVDAMTGLLLLTLSAALIGGFRSFWLTLAGGVGLGVASSLLAYYGPKWGSWTFGLQDALPFFVIVVFLVFRGRPLPLRDAFLDRQPLLGSGRVRLVPLVVVAVVLGLIVVQSNYLWADAFVTTFAVATILLSIVVVTGYAGQISLAQFSVAVFGGWVASRMILSFRLPFELSAVIGIIACIALGQLFALPAVRTRGINLAIVTLGLGGALHAMIFANADYTGGITGAEVGEPTLFGIDIGATLYPERYALVAGGALIVCTILVANLRRGRAGRRLIAVRANERAAASLGIDVMGAKLYAFGLSSAIAAVGGIIYLFRSPIIVFGGLSNEQSITYVGLAVIGGLGFLVGPLVGALLATGSVLALLVDQVFGPGVSSWLQAVSGLLLLLLLIQEPDGAVKANLDQGRWLWKRVRGRRNVQLPQPVERDDHDKPTSTRAHVAGNGNRNRVTPKSLVVRDISVMYGRVAACKDVSLEVEPGTIVGLIGPNGAGKTTLIDAITGFVTPTSGSIRMEGEDLTRRSAMQRSRRGLTRSFQSLELFEDMTVRENMQAASDKRDRIAGLTDLVYPKKPELSDAAKAVLTEFRLTKFMDRRVDSLSYGERRLLSVARAVATGPSVILLDECAAGLTSVESAELATVVRSLADEWGIGVLVVEHDMNFVMSVCDRVVVLEFGEVIADGTPDVVREDNRVKAAYLGMGDTEESDVQAVLDGS
ncbi:branched-chain amino acid ABC transporter permease/ATP-binding protein [Nocardia vaccinii]|uniref:branched-chain amino acid ABC transporter permease/ATP-binding protein n=1 Tax=Nocardia vaccinii TaxID=1822 RepID=UPI00082DA427|nr:branched-chain amino acid ABC transporter permease/ATP-binding protein [Nocardia vaccinii]